MAATTNADSPDDLDEHIAADVTTDIKRRVRVAAAMRDESMAEFIRRAVENELERVE